MHIAEAEKPDSDDGNPLKLEKVPPPTSPSVIPLTPEIPSTPVAPDSPPADVPRREESPMIQTMAFAEVEDYSHGH
jgi:hypothetical protein